jgi:hypothetical protein
MILVREISGLREDILRGVRLFAIVFAAILVCVAAYRILRPPLEAASAPPAASEVAPPSPEPAADAAPASAAEAEAHPLVVPEPPPVGGTPVRKVARPKNLADPGVPPPPPVAPVRARRAAPSGKEFESSETVALPAAPVEDSAEAKPLTPRQAVGYKSLIEANKNRPPAEEAAPAPAEDSKEKPAKGNRFFRAVGKIFHPGKKETTPLALQPNQP